MCSLNQFFNAVNYALRVTNYDNLFLRVKQYQILESILRKRDTIGILPTGYGKSVIFHLIPFAADYLCKTNVGHTKDGNIVLIIAPLNAIIDDQISNLKKHGIEATVLKTVSMNSMTNENDNEKYANETASDSDCEEHTLLTDLTLDTSTEKDIKEGKSKIIYAHPEAFISCKKGRRLLMSSVLQRNVFACVIDEGHLVQEWGLEFRKDFAKLSQLGSLFPESPFLVLTATAPKHLQEALTSSLLLQNPRVIVANLDRPNIFIHKEKRLPASTGEDSFRSILLPIANGLKNELIKYPLTLIYLPLKWCGYAYKLFSDVMGEKSYFPSGDKKPENCLYAQFHAPQTQLMKDEIMKQLQGPNESRTIRVVFATVAIGIGVNILDIRHVLHISVPGTIESLYQEIGRAGRDGKQATACIHYNGHDIALNKPGMTTTMRNFCSENEKCLREMILNYLSSPSQSMKNIAGRSCCSNCSRMCKCPSCLVGPNNEPAGTLLNTGREDDAIYALRHVSDTQRDKLRSLMQKYRWQLGQTGHHIGGIDSRTGVTFELIESVVSQCEYIVSAEDMFLKFEIWDIEHAQSFFKIINDVCEQY
jgi:superfamily II DNA helicase RecQ